MNKCCPIYTLSTSLTQPLQQPTPQLPKHGVSCLSNVFQSSTLLLCRRYVLTLGFFSGSRPSPVFRIAVNTTGHLSCFVRRTCYHALLLKSGYSPHFKPKHYLCIRCGRVKVEQRRLNCRFTSSTNNKEKLSDIKQEWKYTVIVIAFV